MNNGYLNTCLGSGVGYEDDDGYFLAKFFRDSILHVSDRRIYKQNVEQRKVNPHADVSNPRFLDLAFTKATPKFLSECHKLISRRKLRFPRH